MCPKTQTGPAAALTRRDFSCSCRLVGWILAIDIKRGGSWPLREGWLKSKTLIVQSQEITWVGPCDTWPPFRAIALGSVGLRARWRSPMIVVCCETVARCLSLRGRGHMCHGDCAGDRQNLNAVHARRRGATHEESVYRYWQVPCRQPENRPMTTSRMFRLYCDTTAGNSWAAIMGILVKSGCDCCLCLCLC